MTWYPGSSAGFQKRFCRKCEVYLSIHVWFWLTAIWISSTSCSLCFSWLTTSCTTVFYSFVQLFSEILIFSLDKAKENSRKLDKESKAYKRSRDDDRARLVSFVFVFLITLIEFIYKRYIVILQQKFPKVFSFFLATFRPFYRLEWQHLKKSKTVETLPSNAVLKKQCNFYKICREKFTKNFFFNIFFISLSHFTCCSFWNS